MYNETKSINCFAYFTEAIKNAFGTVHNSEKKQIKGKFQYIKQMYCDHPEYDYRQYEDENSDIREEMEGEE